MDERRYRLLMAVAILFTVAWLGWTIYDSFFAHVAPGDRAYLAGENDFADGQYEKALAQYEEALREAPDHVYAWRGKARTLTQLGRLRQALAAFDEAIARAPDFAGSYANRGIAYDRMGAHEQALADYERALALDPGTAEGPGWLTRFLRLQPEKPPTIADRARYLREELARPESDRLLQVPELDEAQRPYKQ
jgi:tetratricopeptide (TPR) repeat protein